MHSVSLTDIPTPEPNISQLRTVTAAGCTCAIYEAISPDPSAQPVAYAVIRFVNALNTLGGAPNDEGRIGHPLKDVLAWQPFQEIVGSPWIEERCRIADRDKNAARLMARGYRHFVLQLKEATLECLATEYRVIGIFPSEKLAFAAAVNELGAN